MRAIATVANDDWGLVEEEEFITSNQQLKQVLLEFGWLKPYDETKPLPPKGLNDYEHGMIYPKDRFIIKDGSIYKSKIETSTSWVYEIDNVDDEWELKIKGLPIPQGE